VAFTALALLLTACGPGAAAGGQPQNVTPTATQAPHPTVLPASTTGWAIYSDQRFHFQAPIPPGWTVRSYVDQDIAPYGECNYIVTFFPPGVTPPDERSLQSHEYIEIIVGLNCAAIDPLKNPNWTPEPKGIMIDGVEALHVVADGADWTDRWAFATFGGHRYAFTLGVTPQEKGQPDLPLFYGMLAGFNYTGQSS
jgi:hypothetical protein